MSTVAPGLVFSSHSARQPIIKPPRLNPGDTIGIIAPASTPFEASAIREGKEAMESLGFKVKLGKYVRKKYGYLAGIDKQRLKDLHDMFEDDAVRAIITIRGGYGSGRLLDKIDYNLIQRKPKILVGYSDISALHLGIHKMTNLVTFHGPVALSTFNEYSTNYFMKILTSSTAIGKIEEPPRDNPRQLSSGYEAIREGLASGPLIGGNLTMVTATLGTPFEIVTKGKIVFLEEVGEEPYDLDRMLTQLSLAGKLADAAGIVIDKCAKCGPAEYKPAFSNTLSIEEVIHDRLHDLKCPVLFGFSLGHVANKPTLPLGIMATLDTYSGTLSIDESAVS
ncbi:LD-carboxypeptidase [candidate division KSB1 bacterium]|nr:LD-carboxypeptidase [candidate division KSB1 bacterium]